MQTIPVIFRAEKNGDHKGEVIAVFPTLPGSNLGASFIVYSRVGQHSCGTLDWYQETRAATESEYSPLLHELRGIYESGEDAVKLDVRTRFLPHYHADRRAEIHASFECDAFERFKESYVAALLWTECEPQTDKDSHDPESHSALHDEIDDSDFSEEMSKQIESDCREFWRENREILKACFSHAHKENLRICGELYGASEAGHDFWLTRNGHGAGFWDRGLGVIGDILTEKAKKAGEVSPYLGDDSLVYLA